MDEREWGSYYKRSCGKTYLGGFGSGESALKEFTRTDVSQMNAVAANKVHDDQSEATTIQSRRV